MTNLLRAEVLRLVSRRLTWALLAGALAIAALAALTTAPLVIEHAEPHPEGIAAFEAAHKDWEVAREQCAADPSCTTPGPEPVISDYIATAMDFTTYASEQVLAPTAAMALLLAAILSASLIGAEFTSGNLGTQLTFTPRRRQVFAAKVTVASVAGVALVVLAMVAAVVLATIAFVLLRGAGDLNSGAEIPLMMARYTLLALLIGVMAASLTMSLGSTLFTYGLFAVVLVASGVVDVMANGVGAWRLVQVLPTTWLFALMTGRAEQRVFNESAHQYQLVGVVHYWPAAAASTLVVACLVAVGVIAFSRRDITR